jgi:hypothetical protein
MKNKFKEIEDKQTVEDNEELKMSVKDKKEKVIKDKLVKK